MALVTMEGTRARRSDDELPRTPAARQALEVLVKARLLVARDTGEGASYEVAHEAPVEDHALPRKLLQEELACFSDELAVAQEALGRAEPHEEGTGFADRRGDERHPPGLAHADAARQPRLLTRSPATG